MKTVLLFTGGVDSTYLAYKLLNDTSDELTMFIPVESQNFTSNVPDWAIRKNHLFFIDKTLSELRKIRDFQTIYYPINGNELSFETDEAVVFSCEVLIPQINQGLYDRIAVGHSWEDCGTMRYFKYVNLNGHGNLWASRKLFKTKSTRGSIWFPLLDHSIHMNYGKYHAFKFLPESIRRNTISCVAPDIESGECGVCGKCLINKFTQKLIDRGCSASEIQDINEKWSLIYGGGNGRFAPPAFWTRIVYNHPVKFPYGILASSENQRKYALISDKTSFINWWNTIEYNLAVDKMILDWNKTGEDFKSRII